MLVDLTTFQQKSAADIWLEIMIEHVVDRIDKGQFGGEVVGGESGLVDHDDLLFGRTHITSLVEHITDPEHFLDQIY